MEKETEVVVIGAGPAGLAVGSSLAAHGIDAVLLDRASRIGDSWRKQYDSLQLNTVRWLSGLPYHAIPRSAGRYPTRDAYAAYLEDYAERFGLDVRLGVAAERVEPAAGGWEVVTDEGSIAARTVVVATGPCREPRFPSWPGRDDFNGEILHASAYRDADRFRGLGVLVVGAGNSGADIAVDVARRGARRVLLSVRTPPHLVPRTVLGVPAQAVGVATRRLPVAITDPLFAALRALAIGDLAAVGLPRPPLPLSRQFAGGDVVPIVDAGFSDGARHGRFRVVAPVQSFTRDAVLLADGSAVSAEAVIVATGYRPALAPLVGHVGVLDGGGRPLVHGATVHAAAPDLFFVGFTNPLSGNLRELGLDARAIARTIAARRNQARPQARARVQALSKEVVP